MKQGVLKAAGIFIYLLMLLYLMGFQLKELFDLRSFLLVLLGTCLLSLPGWFIERDRENWKDMLPFHALYASYIAAAVRLTGTLSKGVLMEDMSKTVAAGLRPILYGLLFYVLFHRENKKKESDLKVDSRQTYKEYSERETAGETQLKHPAYTAEQICYLFRAKGLTAREAEVARLLYLDYTNRMIAEELYISEGTVKKHITHIFEKLGIENRKEIKQIDKHFES